MTKVRFHPLFEHLRGTIKGMVFRLSHNGKISAYMSPDMSRVEQSQWQEVHRECMAEAFAYTKAASKVPEIREIDLQMALARKKNKSPYDMAVWEDYHNHQNLLGDKFRWDGQSWRAMKEHRKSKKQSSCS